MRQEQAARLESATQREADKHFLDDIGADNAVYQCVNARFDVVLQSSLCSSKMTPIAIYLDTRRPSIMGVRKDSMLT